jgi:hypothetical protein
MTYLSWSLYVEGTTDSQYLGVLIPRLISYILADSDGQEAVIPEGPVLLFGIQRSTLRKVSSEACQGKEAFHLLFVHGDAGGRALALQLHHRTCALCDLTFEICEFPKERCVVAAPNREIEAWTLADPNAIRLSFGLRQGTALQEVPPNARHVEDIPDPKAIVERLMIHLAAGRRKPGRKWPYESIAQGQNLSRLLEVPSFRTFAEDLKVALRTLGYPHLR